MVRGTYFPWPYPEKLLLDGMFMSVEYFFFGYQFLHIPVSEKKVLKPSSGSWALRSSVKYPSGYIRICQPIRRGEYNVRWWQDRAYLDTVFKAVKLSESQFLLSFLFDIRSYRRHVVPPSKSWRFGNRPDRLFARSKSTTRLDNKTNKRARSK